MKIDDPIKAIKEHKGKGYRVEIVIDSSRTTLTLHFISLTSSMRYEIAKGVASIDELYKAIYGAP